jgi:hypothetical protein
MSYSFRNNKVKPFQGPVKKNILNETELVIHKDKKEEIRSSF